MAEYSLELRDSVDKVFRKLSKKNKQQLIMIEKKIHQVLKDPYRFKPLRTPLQNLRRVHILKSFVLLYSIKEKSKTVIIEAYDHHDNIYKH